MICLFIAMQLPEISLKPALNTITKSCKIKPGKYPGSTVVIKGDDVTVDFKGAEITGVSNGDLDKAVGNGIKIEGAKNVTIRNAKVHGFAVNLYARNCLNLKIEKCDFSFSGAQGIANGEAPNDQWLVLRELDAWRSYGAGIWLGKCFQAQVKNCKATGAQNGILLVESDKCLVTENDCSFNSGWGVGLWKSCDNTVTWNHADFVNRPWGGGWGGDSSGFVVVNGSDRNMIVANSFTHGGDGFFLTDRVNGGYSEAKKTFSFDGSSNDNTIAYNDGSWSPNNAFEGTFSFRNAYFRNQAEHSGYGFWLGFSSDNHLQYNDINDNRAEGIAIENGHGNWILNNAMRGNKAIAVHLWGGQMPSINNVIGANIIRDSSVAYSLEGSSKYWIEANQVRDASIPSGLTPEERHSGEFPGRDWLVERLEKARDIYTKRPAGWKFFREQGMPLGIELLRAETFAPHDFRKDLVAWRRLDDRSIQLKTIQKGWVLAPNSLVKLDKDVVSGDVKVGSVGQYSSQKVVIKKGTQTQTIEIPLFIASWHLKWFQFAKDKPPFSDKEAWNALFKGKPIYEENRTHLNADFSFKPPAPGVTHEYFVFEAETDVGLPSGTYEVSALADDGIEVLIDSTLRTLPTPSKTRPFTQTVIGAFREHAGTQKGTFVARGVTHIRVRFVQTWGHTYLRFSIRKKP